MAALTTGICVILAPVGAVAYLCLPHVFLRHCRFLALPYCLPPVTVGGLLVLTLGRKGLVNQALISSGLIEDPLQFLYQWWSPLMGTVWMNVSLGILLLIQALEKIPDSVWNMAALLGFRKRQYFRHVMGPAMIEVLIPWGGAVFFVCLSSFGLMILLSGSLEATTLELATWHAIFYDSSWQSAASLMAAQTATALFALSLLWKLRRYQSSGTTMPSTSSSISARLTLLWSPRVQWTGRIFIVLSSLFFFLPLVALCRDVIAWFSLEHSKNLSSILGSVVTSFANASVCAALVLICVLCIAPAQAKALNYGRPHLARIFVTASWLPMLVPSMALALCLLAFSYLLEHPLWRQIAIYIAHAVIVTPLAIAIYAQQWRLHVAPLHRASSFMGLKSGYFFANAEWPLMRRWLLIVVALAFGLSLADTTVVTLLSSSDHPPLTMLIAQLMGSYQFEDAALATLILILITALAFQGSSRLFMERDHV